MAFRRQMVAKWTGLLSDLRIIQDAVTAAASTKSEAWHFDFTLDRGSNYRHLFLVRGNFS